MNVILYLGYLVIVILEIYLKNKNSSSLKKSDIQFFVLLFVCILFGIYRSISYPTYIGYMALILTTYLAAIYFVRDLLKYSFVCKIVLFSFQTSILVSVFIKLGFSISYIESPLENLVEGMSSNGFSTMLIVLQINYFIAKYLSSNKVPVFTCILTFVIAIIGYGRGSILSAFFLLIVSLSFLIKFKKTQHLIFFYIPLIIGIIFIIFINYDEIFTFFYSKTKLSAGLVDYSREKMLTDYLGKIDGITFLFGADYPLSVKSEFNFNPHNSFLRAHHMYGLFYLLLILLTPLYSLIRLPKLKVKILFGLLYAILLFRAYTEPILFPTIFDFFYFSSFLVLPNLYLADYRIHNPKKNHIRVLSKSLSKF